MAFALGTTAGAGTISIVAGGTVVTGTGTNFQAANVGAIIVVGAQWGVIATRTSTTSITLDRPFTTAVTGSAYTVSANFPIITQSGTDTTLAAFNTLAGVTNLSLGDARIYQPAGVMLNITGTLTIPALTEKLVFDNQTDTAVGGTQRDHDVQVSGTLNINLSSVVNGVTIYAPDFVYFSRRPAPSGGGGEHKLNATGSSFYVTPTGTVNLTGGTYVTQFNFACDTGGRLNVTGSYLKGRGNRFWMKTGSITTFTDCTIEGFNIFFNAFPTSISGVTFKNCRTITKETNFNIGFDSAPNVVLSPTWLATASPIINIWGGAWLRVKNSLGGSSLGVLDTAAFPWASGIADFHQDVSFTTKDLAGAAVIGFKFYAAESNDGNRRNVQQYTGVGPFFDNTDIRTMLFTTAAGGVSNAIELRLQAGVTTLTPTATAGSGGLVTTNYGQTTNDEYDFFGIGYSYALYQNRIQCRANGALSIATVALPDLSITQSTMATVAAYTTLSTNAELYDYAKYHLYTNFAGQTATYVTGTGNAGSYNIIINSAAAAVFNFTGSSIVIKTSSFDGDLTTNGSLILAASSVVTNGNFSTPNIIQDIPTALTGVVATGNLNYNTNTPITVTFTDCDIQGTVNNSGSAQVNITLVNSTIGTIGANVVAQQFATISAPNLILGTRVRVYDEDNAVELYNDVLGGAGFSESFVYTSDTTVTLTATYTSGATAKLGLSATGIFTSSGVTFLASQQDDTVYNGYAINGSTVTGFTADYAQDDVNLSMATNFTAASLYAWWVYTLATEDGIRNFFGGITALDSANIQINVPAVSIFLDNNTANFIYQTDTIRLFRSDGAYPAKTVTTGGGGIQVNWNSNVYVGTADISALNNISAADVLTQASAALTAYDAPTKAELDSAVSGLATRDELIVINDGIKKASLLIPHTEDI